MLINPYTTLVGRAKSFMEARAPHALEKYIMPTSICLFDRFFTFPSRSLAKSYLNKDFPLFQTIEIETINRCNGECAFCPINRFHDPRPYKVMDENLFKSIIQQLQDMDYTGSVGLYSNNEPLLDKRIFNFLAYAREALPKCKLYMFTNGTLLTMEKFKKLTQYLDTLIIDNYNNDLELIEPVKNVYAYYEKNKDKHKTKGQVFIYLRKQHEILTNRGGLAKNRTSNLFRLKSACMYPFEQVVVRPDGKLSLCCNDATGKVTMGDLTKASLLDIWHGEKYMALRRAMTKNREHHFLCKNCDVVTPKIDSGEDFNLKTIIKMLLPKRHS